MTKQLTTRLLGLISATLLLSACHDETLPIPDNTPTPLQNTAGSVTIAGNAVTGETLTADVSDFNGISGAITYQWAGDGANIAGATSSTYVVTTAEVGQTITVTASYTDDAGFSEALTSPPTAAVTVPPNVVGVATISGVPTVGETLTANLVDGNGTSGSTLAYQWLANGADIAGATTQTYMIVAGDVNATITVNVSYTDDDGYMEDVTSAGVGPVSTTASNVVGTIAISGTLVVGETLTATVTDPNGTTTVNYQWQADGVDVAGATAETLALTAAELGAVISVSANYTDNDGFMEGPITDTVMDIVYTAIVVGETTLQAAAAAAMDGDIIGLASPSGDDYADMAEVDFAANDLRIQRTAGSTAVISGTTCVVFSGDNIIADGLVFDDLDWIGGGTCDSNGDASVFLDGDGITLSNSEFLGEAFPRTVPSSDPYHYIAVQGVGNLIERNLFEGKDMDNEGSAITLFANTDPDANRSHIIQYNLFRNFLGKSADASNRDSTAHALQMGRTTGGDAQGDGLFTVQYNRFDSIQSERRLMRVQSGGNTIHGNTIVNSAGLIALEDGYANTVTSNIILAGGADSDDGGISFAPLGHTVTDNYINNLRTTSSQRSGLLINPDPLSGSGNGSIIGTAGLDFTVTVARNSVINARRAIQFEDADCAVLSPILDFDDNLVMNQSSALSINGNTNGTGRDAVTDSDFLGAGCSLDAASDFDNNRFYSSSLSQSGTFDFNGAPGDNVSGPEDGATFVQDANDLVNGSGPDAGAGVDTSMLNLIEETQVGPGSTWTP
ncbi:MAG: chondroitinase-B domain-containing protein [Pseudomonadota bacterium]